MLLALFSPHFLHSLDPNYLKVVPLALLPHQIFEQTSSKQSLNSVHPPTVNTSSCISLSSQCRRWRSRWCLLSISVVRNMSLVVPPGGSRPSGIHWLQRNGPTWKCVLLCSVDLINDICIKILSPCGIENSQATTYSIILWFVWYFPNWICK